MTEILEDDVVHAIKNLGSTNLENGKNLKDLMAYRGISLWWFAESYLYRRAGVVIGDVSTFFSYVNSGNKYLVFIKMSIRAVFGRLVKSMRKTQNGKKILVVTNAINWRKTIDLEKKYPNEDIMVGRVIDRLKECNYSVTAVDQTTFNTNDIRTMIEKNSYAPSVWVPLEAYLSFSAIFNTLKEMRKLNKLRDRLMTNERFRNALEIQGHKFDNEIMNTFKLHLPKDVLYFEMMDKAIKEERPDLIMITCEYNAQGMAALLLGKMKGIPTLALQHGIIHTRHFNYMRTKEEITKRISIQEYTIPDKTAVYGQHDKDLLTKTSAYPEDTICITGQPRYDCLNKVHKVYSRDKFVKKYNIDPKHKIVLWATQCDGFRDDENIEFINALFASIKKLKETTLVIKQHPGEATRYTDMIRKYLKAHDMTAVMTPRLSDIFEQLFVCDLLVNRASTVALEAAALDKPIIVLNLSGGTDFMDYVDAGIAIGIYKKEGLAPAIEKLLKDDSVLKKRRWEYIEKHLYRVDGKSTERVVRLVDSMVGVEKETRDQI